MSRLAGPALALVMLTSIPGWAVANTDEGQPPPSAAALTPPPSTDPAVAAERRNLQAAVRMYTGGDVKGARPLLAAALASPVFAEMTEQERYAAHLLYGATLLDAGAGQEALVQLKAGTEFDRAPGEAWVLRLHAAWMVHDDADAIFSLTTIAERWPASLTQLSDRYLIQFIAETKSKANLSANRMEMLGALNQAQWKPNDPFESVDSIWLELTTSLLARGQTQQAGVVANTIKEPRSIAEMRINRAFDPITKSAGTHFDVAQAADLRLAALRAAANAAPDKLEGINAVAVLLVHLGRPTEALEMIDAALKRVQPANGAASPFSDQDQLNWTFDARARALFTLGRFDEAIAQLLSGAAKSEDGDSNVSQVLNLSDVYIDVGRPDDALALIRKLSLSRVSPYGRTVLEAVRAGACEERHDVAGMNGALDYLRAHADVSPGNLLDALLSAGAMDEAAHEIIKMLGDPLQQGNALYALQDFLILDTAPEHLKRRYASIAALRQRPDVKAAIDAVGRIERIPMVADEL